MNAILHIFERLLDDPNIRKLQHPEIALKYHITPMDRILQICIAILIRWVVFTISLSGMVEPFFFLTVHIEHLRPERRYYNDMVSGIFQKTSIRFN